MNKSATSLLLALLCSTSIQAGIIRSPIAVVNTVADSGSPYAIQNTINESGLSNLFVSGVDSFDTYNPATQQHSTAATDEWFDALNTTSATIIYDLGAVYNLARLAFWNEESSGTQTLTVLTCSTATCASAVTIGTFFPTNNPPNANSTSAGSSYTADIFSLNGASSRYVEFLVSGPQVGYTYNSVSIGEVAFDTTTTATPEPSSYLLGLTGLSLLVLRLARRRVRTVVTVQ